MTVAKLEGLIRLDTLQRVTVAALFFVGLGFSGSKLVERVFGQTDALLPRVQSLETSHATLSVWQKEHVREYEMVLRSQERTRSQMEYVVCVLGAQRSGKSEQDCYEENLLGR